MRPVSGGAGVLLTNRSQKPEGQGAPPSGPFQMGRLMPALPVVQR